MNKVSRLIVVSSILLVLSLALLFLTVNQQLQIPYLSEGIQNGVSFFNHLVAQPTQFLSEQKDSLSDLILAYDENKELKQTIVRLESQIAEKATLERENETLRHSLEMSQLYTDKQLIPAMVLVRTPTAWSNQLTIDAGEDKGLAKNMLVIANGGLVGVVTAVYDQSADVKLLSNSDAFTKIPVHILTGTSDVYGILSGYDTDSNRFIVSQLNSAEEIPVGSSVVTSDLAGTTPSSIQIGKIGAIQTSSSSLNRELYVEPTANFSNLYSVLVVGNGQ